MVINRNKCGVNNLLQHIISHERIRNFWLILGLRGACFSQCLGLEFSEQISKKSKVQVFIVNNQYELAKFLKQYLKPENIAIGMGAGSISNWIKELPGLMK